MRDRATAYAERVVSGDVVAGELHVQACRRHLRDLERQGTDEFPYPGTLPPYSPRFLAGYSLDHFIRLEMPIDC